MEHLRTAEVAARIYRAIQNRERFSLVRMADTEANLLWCAKGILPKAQGMAQFNDPDTYPEQTQRLADGVLKASILGLPFCGPNADKGSFRPLLMGGMDLYSDEWGWEFCDCQVHYFLIIGGFFWGLLHDQRLLVMNDNPVPVAEAMLHASYATSVPTYNISMLPAVATVAIDGPGIEPFVDEAAEMADSWDVALVGAGARKMAIIPELAERTGKVVLDMGKVLDRLWRFSEGIWEKMAAIYEEEG